MKTIKLFGATLLVIAGFLIHMLLINNWSIQQQAIVGGAVITCLYLGLAAVFTTNSKSFGEYMATALTAIWPY